MTTKSILFYVFATVTLFFTTSCSMDSSSNPEVKPEKESKVEFSPNETVVRAFNVVFPDAKKVVWSTNSTYNVADFTEYGTSKKAWFDQKGKWQLTQTNTTSNQLPKAVSATFSNGEYSNWNIKSSTILERNNLEDIYTINASNNSSEVKMYYSKAGHLIKTVGNASNSIDKPVEIPAEVKNIVDNLYTNGKILDMWEDMTGIKVAVLENQEYRVVALDSDYDWICTISNLTEQLVPEVVLNSFFASQYGSSAVNDFKLMENKEETTYLIYFNADNKRKIATLKASGSFKSILSY